MATWRSPPVSIIGERVAHTQTAPLPPPRRARIAARQPPRDCLGSVQHRASQVRLEVHSHGASASHRSASSAVATPRPSHTAHFALVGGAVVVVAEPVAGRAARPTCYKVDPDAVAHDSARSWRYRGKVRSCAPHPGQLARQRSPRGCSWPQTTHTASVQCVRTRPSTGSLGGVGAGAESRSDSITCAACQRFARSIGGVGVRRRCRSVLVRAGVRLSVARGHARARSRIRLAQAR